MCISHVALELAFSSLYRDEVHMTESDIPSTVAAASMLQLVRSVHVHTCMYRRFVIGGSWEFSLSSLRRCAHVCIKGDLGILSQFPENVCIHACIQHRFIKGTLEFSLSS